MKKYYFKESEEIGDCIEKCNVLSDETYIGSYACSKCMFCKDYYETSIKKEKSWIKCSRIDEALNNSTSRITRYLSNWIDNNKEKFIQMYGHIEFEDFDKKYYFELFDYATYHDITIFNEFNF